MPLPFSLFLSIISLHPLPLLSLPLSAVSWFCSSTSAAWLHFPLCAELCLSSSSLTSQRHTGITGGRPNTHSHKHTHKHTHGLFYQMHKQHTHTMTLSGSFRSPCSLILPCCRHYSSLKIPSHINQTEIVHTKKHTAVPLELLWVKKDWLYASAPHKLHFCAAFYKIVPPLVFMIYIEAAAVTTQRRISVFQGFKSMPAQKSSWKPKAKARKITYFKLKKQFCSERDIWTIGLTTNNPKIEV